jgi:hypothetical protein
VRRSSRGRGAVSNQRIQRMAYGVSNKEVAQSTADAPNVRHTEGSHERECGKFAWES